MRGRVLGIGAAVVAVGLGWAGTARAADETVGYQGDASHDGVVDDPALRGPWKPLWRVTPSGAEPGRPASVDQVLATGGRVFVMSQPGYSYFDPALTAYAADDGRQLWQRYLETADDPDWIPALSAGAGRLYLTTRDGEPAALDQVTGDFVWGPVAPLPYLGADSEPVPYGGRLYQTLAGSGSAFAVLDAATGTRLGSVPLDSGDSRPAVDGSGAYVSLTPTPPPFSFGLDGALRGGGTVHQRVVGDPDAVVSKGLLLFRSDGRDRTDVRDARTGALRGTIPMDGEVAAVDDDLIVGRDQDGTLRAFDRDGLRPRWEVPTDLLANSVPLIINGAPTATSEDGHLRSYAPATGAVVRDVAIGPAPGQFEGFTAALRSLAAGDGVVVTQAADGPLVVVGRPGQQAAPDPDPGRPVPDPPTGTTPTTPVPPPTTTATTATTTTTSTPAPAATTQAPPPPAGTTTGTTTPPPAPGAPPAATTSVTAKAPTLVRLPRAVASLRLASPHRRSALGSLRLVVRRPRPGTRVAVELVVRGRVVRRVVRPAAGGVVRIALPRTRAHGAARLRVTATAPSSEAVRRTFRLVG